MMMMNCFCGMVDQRKALSLISSRDHCQRSSPWWISDMPRAWFEPVQNLSADCVEWSCTVVITNTLHLPVFDQISLFFYRKNLKSPILGWQVWVNLICDRNFGKVIFHISKHHDGKVSIKQLCNLKKNHDKFNKAILDLNFLFDCKTIGVVPKFLCFNLPYTNDNDSKAIQQRLLRSAIRKRTNEKYKLTKNLQESTKDVKSIVTGIEWLVLEKAMLKNVNKKRTLIIKAHKRN